MLIQIEANTFIKPSPIHGLGLFAVADILKGEVIIQGKANMNEFKAEWIHYNKKEKSPSVNFQYGFCMMNHSDAPNTHRDTEMIISASRDIKKGEEITEDYNKLPDTDNPFYLMRVIEEFHKNNAACQKS